MISLRPFSPDLRPLYPATLLQGSVVGLYAPTRSLQLFALRFAHLKVVGGPVLNAAVSGNCPEYLHHPVGLQMYYPSSAPISTSSMAMLPLLSGFTKRLLFSRHSQRHPWLHIALRLSRELYQESNRT